MACFRLRTDRTVTTKAKCSRQTTTDKRDVVLRICRCGWSKATTYRGLRIHQGHKGCLGKKQHSRSALQTAGQTTEDVGQVHNHRPQDQISEAPAPSSSSPVVSGEVSSENQPEEELGVGAGFTVDQESMTEAVIGTSCTESSVRKRTGAEQPESEQREQDGPTVCTAIGQEQSNVAVPVEHAGSLDQEGVPQLPETRSREPVIERKEKIKWPRANDKAAWEDLDSDLHHILDQGLKGDVERKLNQFGSLVYDFCSERFGVLESSGRKQAEVVKGRREREIASLVKKRRQLRKRWRKASREERPGLEALWQDIRVKLKALRRAERLRRKRKRKEKERSQFFKNPYKFARSLLEESKGGTLQVPKEELDLHLKQTYSDPQRREALGSPGYVPSPPEPEVPFDVATPRWSEIETAVGKARAAAAPGPNGVPYRVYKQCPKTLRLLWNLFRVAWRKQCIPVSWRRAGGVLIPKEKDSSTINQFRNISLLNVEGKLFFSVVAKRLTSFLIANKYIDTEVQKAGIPGSPGCSEHASMIWGQIQTAKRQKEDLHVIWLDLANAYGSVPHSLIHYAMDFFWVPDEIKGMVRNYFEDFRVSISTPLFVSEWQQLEKGIPMGCTISPLLFVMGFEVLLTGARQVVGGVKLPSGQRLPPLRAFMDDVTTILRTAPCTNRVLRRLEELTKWARMKFKPTKSRSLSLRKGKVSNRVFTVDGQCIPTIEQTSVRSLGRLYTKDLSDSKRGQEVVRQACEGLKSIDSCQLPGKLKIWCTQFVLLPRLKWPLKMYEISLTTVEEIERKMNAYIRKWLGVPRCLSNVALVGQNKLSLPIVSIADEFKLEKVRLALELQGSKDASVRAAYRDQKSGRKWQVGDVVNQAVSRLRHKDIVGAVQHGRQGLGWGGKTLRWDRANPRERKQLVVDEVKRMESEKRRVTAISQKQQGAWVNWEEAIERRLSWKDIWEIQSCRLSFLVRAVYDVLPSPQNVNRWFQKEEACQLCGLAGANLKHVLSSCNTALKQGRFTWRHNNALRVLAAAVEEKRGKSESEESAQAKFIPFVKEGQKPVRKTKGKQEGGILRKGVWNMAVDLENRLCFPKNICVTSLRPDLVAWSEALKTVIIVELSVPWEENMQSAYERKKLKYQDLTHECKQSGWNVLLYPVEVGCRGFPGSSLARFCKEMAIDKKVLRNMAQEVEKSSFWLWIKRKENTWGKTSEK
ncbi:uncharacterized protein LOC144885536 [Branchiostoma floridae x Branchiostoma japonicum]